jgi:hypothetical protein
MIKTTVKDFQNAAINSKSMDLMKKTSSMYLQRFNTERTDHTVEVLETRPVYSLKF